MKYFFKKLAWNKILNRIYLNYQARKKQAYTDSGEVHLDFYEVRPVHSFMDYVKGGTQLHCSIAIDFTGENFMKLK